LWLTNVRPCGIDFRRVHPPAFRASGCSAAISRHEMVHGTALLLAPLPVSAKAGSVPFVRNRIALPRRGEESNPVPSNTKGKNMNTTENINPTPQPTNHIVKSVKFPPQPQEWKIVSLRECPTPEAMQLCETPTQAADYWRTHITQHPYFKIDVSYYS
jgi:hypothetical protein